MKLYHIYITHKIKTQGGGGGDGDGVVWWSGESLPLHHIIPFMSIPKCVPGWVSLEEALRSLSRS